LWGFFQLSGDPICPWVLYFITDGSSHAWCDFGLFIGHDLFLESCDVHSHLTLHWDWQNGYPILFVKIRDSFKLDLNMTRLC